MIGTELIRLLMDAPNNELKAKSKSGKNFVISGAEFAVEDDVPVTIIRIEAE